MSKDRYLDRCPFCGHDKAFVHMETLKGAIITGVEVACGYCEVNTRTFYFENGSDPEECILMACALWNKRA